MKKLFPFNKRNFATGFIKATTDVFKNMYISASELPLCPEEFSSMIRHSTEQWIKERKTGIWIEIPNRALSLLPKALESGFMYHHTGGDSIVLTKWIGEGESKIPLYCTHYVGCGGKLISFRVMYSYT